MYPRYFGKITPSLPQNSGKLTLHLIYAYLGWNWKKSGQQKGLHKQPFSVLLVSAY
jgi:hypothetical protein